MKKLYYNWAQTEGAVISLARDLQKSNWRPDYIVGLTRGGLVPAVMLSQYLEVPMHALKVSLRDGGDTESNCWMAEDAYGYNGEVGKPVAKNILIVDDINDSGSTIAWIKQDWRSSCLPNDARWDHVWGQNVRFAVLTDNLASDETVDYSVWEVNKGEEDCWLVFPWEEFWHYDN
jgi:hypoxanthine phosphoribosyltransferase